MTYVNSMATTPGAPTTGSTAVNATGFNQLADPSTFLQLLVAQLKNQDPSNPSDPTAFMTEIAQLTAVESQTSLNSQEQAVAADSMLGRAVTGTTASGPVTGTVTGVLLSGSGNPQLEVTLGDGTIQDLDLTAISKVTQAAPTSDGSAAAAGTTSSTTPSTNSTAA
jgi:flagellar basal-body rod modification protein FlgD